MNNMARIAVRSSGRSMGVLVTLASLVPMIASDDVALHPVCDATRQMFQDKGCCGDDGTTVSVCVSPTLDLSALTAPRTRLRQAIGEDALAALAMPNETITVYHDIYGYDRLRTAHGREAGFVPEALYWLHALTGARVQLVREWRSPETDTLNGGDSHLFLGWKDIIPNRYPSRAPHLTGMQDAAPSCAMRHYLIVRTVDKPYFAQILSDPALDTPYKRARALYLAGLRVATCNCEQYDLWRDPEYGFGNFTLESSMIFGAPGRPGITDYDRQWTTSVASCTRDTPDCSDWTFTNDHRSPYYVAQELPASLEIIEIEMAVPSAQWVFYNNQKPQAAKMGAALRTIVDTGLYDYSFCRWKHTYTRGKESEHANAYANEARARAETLPQTTVEVDAQSFSFATELHRGADVGLSSYVLDNGHELHGYVERFASVGGVVAAASAGPAGPPPPPLPPAPPYVAPSPGEFCAECNFGFFDEGNSDPFA